MKSIFSNVLLKPGKWKVEMISLKSIFHWGLHWHSVVSFNYHFPDSTIIHELPCVLKKLWAVLANVMAYYEAQLCSKREGVIMHWSILLACFLFELLGCQQNAELFIQNLLLFFNHCASIAILCTASVKYSNTEAVWIICMKFTLVSIWLHFSFVTVVKERHGKKSS